MHRLARCPSLLFPSLTFTEFSWTFRNLWLEWSSGGCAAPRWLCALTIPLPTRHILTCETCHSRKISRVFKSVYPRSYMGFVQCSGFCQNPGFCGDPSSLQKATAWNCGRAVHHWQGQILYLCFIEAEPKSYDWHIATLCTLRKYIAKCLAELHVQAGVTLARTTADFPQEVGKRCVMTLMTPEGSATGSAAAEPGNAHD